MAKRVPAPGWQWPQVAARLSLWTYEREHVAVYYVRAAYLWIIYLSVGFMVLHNLLDLRRKALSPPLPAPRRPSPRQRMSTGFRVAHALLLASFGLLVYTGFALKYPESWWAAPLLTWESSFGLRGWIHRLAGVALLLAGVVHVLHLAIDRGARRCIRAMWPGRVK